ncbi:MAG: SDR family oxidoreductase [Lachnospiraceae bacterium]|nr:SDR family oxidoreductase [Lachnospiraceae bacterium]
MMFSSKKTVMITGANGGIGRALVTAFAKEGCDIIAHLRNEKEEFMTFCDEVKKEYDINIDFVFFDLTVNENIKNGFKELAKQKRTIDILVNNAGMAHGGLLQMTSLNDMKYVFDINFFAPVQIIQCVTRFMIRQGGGAIVNIASISGIELEEGNCAYGTSKAALIALTKTIAKEYAIDNIRINAVAPGLTDTKMAALMEEKAGIKMIRDTAFKRLAKPEEIADAVVYLASEKSSFITGQVLRVDGGM